MIRVLSAVLLALPAVLVTAAPAAAQGPRGLSVGIDRHGLSDVSLTWSRAPRSATRYARTPVVRARYGATCAPRTETVWRVETVWVPATRRKVWVEPLVRVGYDACGRRVETVVRPGHWKTVVTPGRFEERKVRTRVVASRPVVVRRY